MSHRQGLPPRRVVAWGTSVLASALAAGLAARSGLELEQVEATLPAALAALQRRAAHAVVVCDPVSVPAAYVLRLLEAHPRLTVVIVNPDAGRAQVLTCRQVRMRTVDDLAAVLLDGAGDDGVADEGRRAGPGGRKSRPSEEREGG